MQQFLKKQSTEENQLEALKTHSYLPSQKFVDSESIGRILDDLMNPNDTKWISNTGNGSGHLPPDFVNSEDALMMDIMAVGDIHTQKNGKKNIQKQREAKLKKELENFLGREWLSSREVFVNPDTSDIPTDNHHNYKSYVKNTKRILNKHIESIPLYRKNHPTYKLIFLIFDESTSYVEGERYQQVVVAPRNHIPYRDKEMMMLLFNADVDYVIWFQPYMNQEAKEANYKDGLLPVSQIAGIDLSTIKEDYLQSYNEDKMHSYEK